MATPGERQTNNGGHESPALEWTASGVAACVVLYVLTAPPIILAHTTQTGSKSIPAFYDPLMRVAFSHVGGPIVWYFNQVWHAHLMALGREPKMAWHIILVYLVIGVIFISAIFLPFMGHKGDKGIKLVQ